VCARELCAELADLRSHALIKEQPLHAVRGCGEQRPNRWQASDSQELRQFGLWAVGPVLPCDAFVGVAQVR
jgi:hypothetical protein